MRRRFLVAILAALAVLPTGCMMMDIDEDDEQYVAEYRRDLPRTVEKQNTIGGAYGGSEKPVTER